MDKVQEASFVIKQLNKYYQKELADHELIKDVCGYFDKMKDSSLKPSDLKYLKYISNIVGIPHYYDMLFSEFQHDESFCKFDLNTVSAMIYESTLHVDANIKVHKHQKKIFWRISSL